MRLFKFFIRITLLLFILFAVFVFTMSVLGYEPAVIISGSMRPKMPIGTICFIDKKYPFKNYRVGDIIVYISKNKKVVHRIVEKNDHGYRTKGDANINVDVALITEEIYYGKCVFYIPYIGLIVMTFQSFNGKVLLLGSLVLILTTYFMLDDLDKEKNNRNIEYNENNENSENSL